MKQDIITSQIGFYPKDEKKAVIRGGVPNEFTVNRTSDHSVVFSGKTKGPYHNPTAQEVNYIADFSGLTECGNYYVAVEGLEPSFPFEIGTEIYDELVEKTTHFFYLQRCGCRLPKLLAGDYSHESCHDTLARIHGTDQFLDVNGGWHDAGDYGRYIVAAAVTVADLLLAYENNPELMGRIMSIPESGSKMPYLLSEIRYELEWMLKMQDAKSGKVYHKVTCFSFPGFVMPEEEKEELVISPFSATATGTFAAVMAMAMRFYAGYDDAFARTCMQAASKAYDAMKGMFMPGGFRNPSDVVTGEYGDANDLDERYWAAAELYKTTGEAMYHDDFKQLAKEKILHGYGWEDVGSFGNMAYLTTTHQTDAHLTGRIQESMIVLADEYVYQSEHDGYDVGLGAKDYKWGSNMLVAGIGNHLYDAFRISGDDKYSKAAKEQLHYLLGKNPMGYCYVTGFGTKYPMYPHHRPSAAVNKPMPGMLVGGPDCGLHDPDAEEHLKGMPPAKCFVDTLGSYSTNEITIYWNSALLYLMAAVCE